MEKPNVVAIGGGSGLSVLLRGLRIFPVNISAIVTMTDDGSSSGRLRRDYGILPPGDIRQCLVALSNDEELATKLFDYRFPNGRGLSGHNFGNLFLTALCDITGSFEQAVREASQILATSGKVIPSTLSNVNIAAELENGHVVLGESNIPVMGHRTPIKRVFCVPDKIKANIEAIQAIQSADFIIIGPGSLYTSIIPNLLIKGITKAILDNKKAQKVFVCNISTERGETEKYSTEDHIDALLSHSSPDIITACLINDKVVHANGDEGKLGFVHNITSAKQSYKKIKLIRANLIDDKRPLFHDFKKIVPVLASILKLNQNVPA
ncbi:MAG: YvcK family protein [bacterium]|nr:YvcK family protein [bacterium]